jgi:hypothetical protein
MSPANPSFYLGMTIQVKLEPMKLLKVKSWLKLIHFKPPISTMNSNTNDDLKHRMFDLVAPKIWIACEEAGLDVVDMKDVIASLVDMMLDPENKMTRPFPKEGKEDGR